MRGMTYAPGQKHEWIEFSDPDDADHFWRINVSLFLSNYNCIYGSGCPSVKFENDPNPAGGCCVQGVRFVDDEDFAHVESQVARLTEADSANLKHIREVGWWMKRPSDGTPYKTRKKGGMCIFSNPVPSKPGDPPMGCSFHHLAEREVENYNDTKPDICWKVPLSDAYEYDDSQKIGITTLTMFSASSWGGRDESIDEDGEVIPAYLDYFCTDTPDAYNGSEKYYIASGDVLTKIMGEAGYQRLCEVLEEYGERKFKMPGELVNDGKPMIADIVSLKQSLLEKRVPDASDHDG